MQSSDANGSADKAASGNPIVLTSPNADQYGAAGDDWGLSEQIVQLKLGASDGHQQLSTPPTRTAPNMAALEASPLDVASASSGSPAPSDRVGGIVHSRESSVEVSSPASSRLGIPASASPTAWAPPRRPNSYSGGLAQDDLSRLRSIEESRGSFGQLASAPLDESRTNPGFEYARQMANKLATQENGLSTVKAMEAMVSGLSGSADREREPTRAANRDREEQPKGKASRVPPALPLGRSAGAASPAFGNGAPRYGQNGSVGGPYNGQVPAFSQQPSGPLHSPGFSNFGPAPGGPRQHGPGPVPSSLQMQMAGMYDMNAPLGMHEHPAVARIQAQHGGPFRPALGGAAAAQVLQEQQALMLAGAGAFGPVVVPPGGMYSPPPGTLAHNLPPPPSSAGLFGPPGTPFFPGALAGPPVPQEMYTADLMQAMRLQQFAQAQAQAQAQAAAGAFASGVAAGAQLGALGAAPPGSQNATNEAFAALANANGNGPSVNNRKLGLYKTEMCRSWEEKGTCRYGAKCQFAHGADELRQVPRHPKYKTEICRTFWVSGSCPYGKRCCFIHDPKAPGSSIPGGDSSPDMSSVHRERSGSTSTTGDSAEGSSLLARISAKRAQGVASAAAVTTPVSANTESPSTPQAGGFSSPGGGRPGSLRVDTASLTGTALANSKENKSAYPAFQQSLSKSLSQMAAEPMSAASPVAVTAHPDFGRSGLSRLDLAATSQARVPKPTASPNNRHSFNGTDMNLNFESASTLTTPVQTAAPSLGPPRGAGHIRSGSAGNWPVIPRGSRLSGAPYSPIPSADLRSNSPWAANELNELPVNGASQHN